MQHLEQLTKKARALAGEVVRPTFMIQLFFQDIISDNGFVFTFLTFEVSGT